MYESEAMDVLLDWNYWGNFNRKFLERPEYMKRLEAFLSGRGVIVVKGVRRSGKSSLAYSFLSKLFERNIVDIRNTLIVNFEDPRLPPSMSIEDLYRIYEVYMRRLNPEGRVIVVLDEVQYVKGWERFVRWLVEAKDFKVIVTGSSSRLMSEEYATVLTGRHLDVEVYPLSFKEFLMFKGVRLKDEVDVLKQRFKIQNLVYEYLSFGGFPEVVLSEGESMKIELLRNYFNDILMKDVVKRFKVRNVVKLEELARSYISNISTIQSFNKLKRALGVSLDTIERFSRYLEVARLLLFLDKFSFSIREQRRSMKKVYTIDVGFYTSSGFKFMKNMWRVMENVVAVNILSRRLLNPEIEVYYYKLNQREIDFLIKEGIEIKQLIQVTYASGRDEINEREINTLVKAGKELGCNSLTVVTWDYEEAENYEGKTVRFIPLWKWLLSTT